MVTREDVERFLLTFRMKASVFGIVFFGGREKNMRTMAELGITATHRQEIILGLTVEDYYQGPEEDTLNQLGDMWMFGKSINGYDVYIKITLGRMNGSTICISFHVAEYPIVYPFKEDNI